MAKTVWITGASSGIGRALAMRFARMGSTVIATARRAHELERLSRDAADLPGRILPAPGDVTDEAAMREIIAVAEERAPVDLSVLNAGLYLSADGAAFDAAPFRTSFDVNVMGVVNGLAAVLPHMVARRRGRVALMGSIAGYGALPTSAAYGASKAALIHLAAGLKFDLDRVGVAIQVIDPGFVDTGDVKGFPRPFLVPLERAVDCIVAGLERDVFEIAFPRRFAVLMKVVNLLPYRLYFAAVSRAARGGVSKRRPT